MTLSSASQLKLCSVSSSRLIPSGTNLVVKILDFDPRPTDRSCLVIPLYGTDQNNPNYSKAAPIRMSVTLLDSIRAIFWAHQWQAFEPVNLDFFYLATKVNAILSARVHATSIPSGLE